MNKAPTARLRRALALYLPVLFLFGCSSTSQPERASQVAAAPVPPPAARDEVPHSVAPPAEPSPAIAIDTRNAIIFPLGSSTVSQGDQDKVLAVAQRLKADQHLHLTLVGHAIENGSRSFNVAVAEARIESIAMILKKHGVKTYRITQRNQGSEGVPKNCRSARCQQVMRRVDLLVSAER